MSTKSTTKKRVKRTEGITPSSATRILKKGADIQKGRISEAAVKSAIRVIENEIENLGRRSIALLEYSKTKTITPKLVIGSIDRCDKKILYAARTAVAKDKQSKEEAKHTLSTSSVMRTFWNNQKGDNRVSAEAKIVIVSIASDMLERLGRSAGLFASTANRVTILPKDIDAAVKAWTQ